MPPLRNLITGSLMLALATYGAVKAYLYFDAERRVAQAFAPLAALGSVRYEEMSVSLLGPVTLQDVRLTPHGALESISFGRLVLEDYRAPVGYGVPARLAVRGEEVRIAAPLIDRWLQPLARGEGPAVPDLQALGYTHLVGDFSVDWGYSADSGAVRLRLSADGRQVGRVALGLLMDEMPLSMLTQPTARGKFRSFFLQYEDRSLAGRLLAAFAHRAEKDPATYKKELLETLRAADPERPWNIGAVNLEQIRRFLATPDGFVIRMQPYEPVSLDELRHYSEGDLPLLFNLQMQAL